MKEYGLGEIDPTEPEKCTMSMHVFDGPDVGNPCECGEQIVTQQDVDHMLESPMGMLMAADMCLPVVLN